MSKSLPKRRSQVNADMPKAINENTAFLVRYCADSHFEITELLNVIHETAYNCVNEGRQEDFENALQRIVHLARFGASAVFDRCEYISCHPGAEGAWGKP